MRVRRKASRRGDIDMQDSVTVDADQRADWPSAPLQRNDAARKACNYGHNRIPRKLHQLNMPRWSESPPTTAKEANTRTQTSLLPCL